MYWELEKDGCESEFIVGSFDNRMCVSSGKIRELILRDMFS